MDLTQFETPEALKIWIQEQEDPDEATEVLGDLLQGDELQGKPA